jgi:hypothetical protein
MFRFSLILVLLALFITTSEKVSAYNPSINDTAIPYEIYVMDSNIKTQAEYLGSLDGDPHMYEFTIGESVELTLNLRQLEATELIPFSIIIVKQNSKNAGVVEVGRISEKDARWQTEFEPGLGLTFLRGETFIADMTPGVYLVEVSTPVNYGSYLLTVGDEPLKVGYFKTLQDVRTIQKFFNKSIFLMLKSSYLLYPTVIIILLILLFLAQRKYRWLQKVYA